MAFGGARQGDVLVIDNGGRLNEACVGDLAVLEAGAAGLAGLTVWGLHRDSPELAEIGLPVFSYGSYPPGPLRLDEREPEALAAARFGPHLVSSDDVVFGDDDGVLFVPAGHAGHAGQVLATAHRIWQVAREQARRIQVGPDIAPADELRRLPGTPRRRSVLHLPPASQAYRRRYRGVDETRPGHEPLAGSSRRCFARRQAGRPPAPASDGKPQARGT